MAYVAPSTQVTGDLITAAIWNQNVVNNMLFVHDVDCVRVYNDANITITTGTDTALTFNQERYDTNAMHSTVSNPSRLTCVTTGKYNITGNVQWADTMTAANLIKLWIELNGTTIIGASFYASVPAGAGVNLTQVVSTDYALTATDYVELHVRHNEGADETILCTANYSPEFMMHRIA